MTVNLDKELARRVIQASQDGNLTQDECDLLRIDEQTCKEVQDVVKIAQTSPEFLNSLSGPGGMNLTKARAEFFAGKIKSLRADFNSGDPYLRYLAIEDLRKMGPEAEAALPDIIKALSDKDVRVVRSALYTVDSLSEKAIQEIAPEIIGVFKNWSDDHRLPFDHYNFIKEGPGSLMFAAKMLTKAGATAVPEIVRFIRDNLEGEGSYKRRCLGLVALYYMRKAGVDISEADSLLREIEDSKCQAFLEKNESRQCLDKKRYSNPMVLAISFGYMDDYNLARAALGKGFLNIYANEEEWRSEFRPGSL